MKTKQALSCLLQICASAEEPSGHNLNSLQFKGTFKIKTKHIKEGERGEKKKEDKKIKVYLYFVFKETSNNFL